MTADDDSDNGGKQERDPDLRNFGETLAACRKRAGLTQEEFRPLVGYSVQYVASVEQGRRHPSPKFVNKANEVLDTYEVLQIAARNLSRRRGLAAWFRRWAELEEQAVILNTYECRVVPGLLQTENYARAQIANVPPMATAEEVEDRIAQRLVRQELLTRTPYISFSFIIEQSVIERCTGGLEVTREVIDRLLECGQLPNVDIQIMPTFSPEHAGTDGSFRLLQTQEHEWMGYTEGQQTGRVITEPEDVSFLHQRYAKLRIQALNPVDSAGLLMRLRGSL
ncbi:helix-turn-helix transcriptional regulator [Streptomyces sp. NBC_00249]|uniref:helix-turn-helix domain-containing protein n=1 Tax=Streptomyces sp. NBC_00249 TaxID=2975690 RepID=UPI0022511B48|nr:helix-turn-helix transcriptional regulator [Streptomyces sp. NBC_00249]MCX5198511.1 helix-turn-helix transcriptional regulator [Streptomyces sp. NBC_00249]